MVKDGGARLPQTGKRYRESRDQNRFTTLKFETILREDSFLLFGNFPGHHGTGWVLTEIQDFGAGFVVDVV